MDALLGVLLPGLEGPGMVGGGRERRTEDLERQLFGVPYLTLVSGAKNVMGLRGISSCAATCPTSQTGQDCSLHAASSPQPQPPRTNCQPWKPAGLDARSKPCLDPALPPKMCRENPVQWDILQEVSEEVSWRSQWHNLVY